MWWAQTAPPLVGIGLTDLYKSGGAIANPVPTVRYLCLEVAAEKGIQLFDTPYN